MHLLLIRLLFQSRKMTSLSFVPLLPLQVPFYRGERITFDVAPSRMNFKVEHKSLKLEVKSSNSDSPSWFCFVIDLLSIKQRIIPAA